MSSTPTTLTKHRVKSTAEQSSPKKRQASVQMNTPSPKKRAISSTGAGPGAVVVKSELVEPVLRRSTRPSVPTAKKLFQDLDEISDPDVTATGLGSDLSVASGNQGDRSQPIEISSESDDEVPRAGDLLRDFTLNTPPAAGASSLKARTLLSGGRVSPVPLVAGQRRVRPKPVPKNKSPASALNTTPVKSPGKVVSARVLAALERGPALSDEEDLPPAHDILSKKAVPSRPSLGRVKVKNSAEARVPSGVKNAVPARLDKVGRVSEVEDLDTMSVDSGAEDDLVPSTDTTEALLPEDDGLVDPHSLLDLEAEVEELVQETEVELAEGEGILFDPEDLEYVESPDCNYNEVPTQEGEALEEGETSDKEDAGDQLESARAGSPDLGDQEGEVPRTRDAPSPASGVPAVMDVTLQDPLLRDYYASMPPDTIPPYAAMLPYDVENAEACGAVCISYRTLRESLPLNNDRARLRLSLEFVSYRQFFNICRGPKNLFRHAYDCFKIRDTHRDNAIFVVTGVLRRSDLSNPSGDCYKIRLSLLEQEYQLFQGSVGAIAGLSAFHAPVYAGVVAFSTKKSTYAPKYADGGSGQQASSSSSSRFAAQSGVTMPVIPGFRSSAGGGSVAVSGSALPAFRLYRDKIPVYDGRSNPKRGINGFAFRDRDWDQYTSLPKYPHDEIKLDSLVTVGFTLSRWDNLPNAQFKTCHFNALFAIVLAEPLGN